MFCTLCLCGVYSECSVHCIGVGFTECVQHNVSVWVYRVCSVQCVCVVFTENVLYTVYVWGLHRVFCTLCLCGVYRECSVHCVCVVFIESVLYNVSV